MKLAWTVETVELLTHIESKALRRRSDDFLSLDIVKQRVATVEGRRNILGPINLHVGPYLSRSVLIFERWVIFEVRKRKNSALLFKRF